MSFNKYSTQTYSSYSDIKKKCPSKQYKYVKPLKNQEKRASIEFLTNANTDSSESHHTGFLQELEKSITFFKDSPENCSQNKIDPSPIINSQDCNDMASIDSMSLFSFNSSKDNVFKTFQTDCKQFSNKSLKPNKACLQNKPSPLTVRKKNKSNKNLIRRNKQGPDFDIEKKKILRDYRKKLDLLYLKHSENLKNYCKKSIKNKEKQFEENYNKEIEDVESKQEAKLKSKLSQVIGDYDRQVGRLKDENNWLKKINEDLKKQAEEANLKCKVFKNTAKSDVTFSSNLDEPGKEYDDLCRAFYQLQSNYKQAKNEKNKFCNKCKAFINQGDDLSQKILRIRSYIDSA